MLTLAYTECGLSVEEFFNLSWYEWSLEIDKVKKRNERDFKIWEGHAALHRMTIAMIANVNRDPKKRPTPYDGKDFIKLSFDEEKSKEPRETRELTAEEIEKKFGNHLKK